MEHWARYKDHVLNMSQIRGFSVRRIDADEAQSSYYKDMGASKQKKWLLYAEGIHPAIGAFASKDEAMRVAIDIVSGKYDLK